MKYVIYNPTYKLYAGELKGHGFKSYKTLDEAHHFNNKETAETISNLLSVAVYSSACRVLEVNAE